MKKGFLNVLREKVGRLLSEKQQPSPEAFKLHFSDGAKIREENLHKIEVLEKLLTQPQQSPIETPASPTTKRTLNLQHMALDPELPG